VRLIYYAVSAEVVDAYLALRLHAQQALKVLTWHSDDRGSGAQCARQLAPIRKNSSTVLKPHSAYEVLRDTLMRVYTLALARNVRSGSTATSSFSLLRATSPLVGFAGVTVNALRW
jgi:hypothetical protein